MEFTECVRSDRATRAFTDEPVPEERIEALIDLARRAGSGKNRQPWSFVVVRERDRLEELASLGEYTTPLRRAPVGIVLLADDRGDGVSTSDAFDCGRAFQNMKLAATDAGLGSVPQSVDPEGAGELLSIPDSKRVLIALAVGHPAEPEDTIEGERKAEVLESMGRRPLNELIHRETHR